MRPFGCPLTILNTLDHLGKFDGKSEEGYLLGYSTNSKGFRVYNRVTRKVQDCLHVNFLENQENQKGKGPDWMFDLDLLTPSMNYIPVRKENYADSKEQGKTCDDAEEISIPAIHCHTTQYKPSEWKSTCCQKKLNMSSEDQALHDELRKRGNTIAKEKEHVTVLHTKYMLIHHHKDTLGNTTPTDSDDDTPTIWFPTTPTLRIIKIQSSKSNYCKNDTAGVQTRRKLQDSTSNQHQALLSFIYKQNRTNHKDQQTCLFACFLSQEEPKKVSQALADESWVEAMQEELLQFKLQENKARLVAQGYRQEEGVDYDEVFAPVARIEAIRLFLAFASFMGFIVYQMDVKSAFLYGNITEEVPRAMDERLSTFSFECMDKGGAIDKTLFIKKDRRDIMLVQVNDWVSLMYLTLPDQTSSADLSVVQDFQSPTPRPPFSVWNFSDSDYAGDNHDRRSTSGGCQYLGRRLVSWQCKKQTIVAISSTEAEYVAAASCCAQVLWMQNQLLDYGFNFMHTEIHIDNESTICIVKNPVFHSKTKHIQIRHHFIRDCYEQRLINVVKVHTDDNVQRFTHQRPDLAKILNALVVTMG
ncbi:putative ribonuclease H-like domain-containing protein [Tanacetum coccineum]